MRLASSEAFHLNSGSITAKKAILDRIQHLEEAIAKGRAYLESGKHAHWHGFRPLFAVKVRDGKTLPPHENWAKNVLLPSREAALRNAHKTLEKLNQHELLSDARPYRR